MRAAGEAKPSQGPEGTTPCDCREADALGHVSCRSTKEAEA